MKSFLLSVGKRISKKFSVFIACVKDSIFSKYFIKKHYKFLIIFRMKKLSIAFNILVFLYLTLVITEDVDRAPKED